MCLGTACAIDGFLQHTKNDVNICSVGVHPNTVRLLPEEKQLPSSDEKENPDGVFSFDGKAVAFEVAPKVFNGRLESRFTISTWLRHQRQSAESEEVKQHILCNADGEGNILLVD